jgi:hypothetical protein
MSIEDELSELNQRAVALRARAAQLAGRRAAMRAQIAVIDAGLDRLARPVVAGQAPL